jgi:hypothetical protein
MNLIFYFRRIPIGLATPRSPAEVAGSNDYWIVMGSLSCGRIILIAPWSDNGVDP